MKKREGWNIKESITVSGLGEGDTAHRSCISSTPWLGTRLGHKLSFLLSIHLSFLLFCSNVFFFFASLSSDALIHDSTHFLVDSNASSFLSNILISYSQVLANICILGERIHPKFWMYRWTLNTLNSAEHFYPQWTFSILTGEVAGLTCSWWQM